MTQRPDKFFFCKSHCDIILLYMKTISIAVDEHLLEQIDTLAQARHKKRAELFSEAARQWLKQQRLKALVKQDRQGYRKKPVQADEFEPLLRAQQWEKM